MRDATIDDYKWLYANSIYMHDGLKCAYAIMPFIKENIQDTFLDYGCGRGQLVDWINQQGGDAVGFDPALGGELRLSDWVISCDVLEHIHKRHVTETLKALRAHARKGLILTIANMSDPCRVRDEEVELHLIQEPASWWIDRIITTFQDIKLKYDVINSDRFAFIVIF